MPGSCLLVQYSFYYISISQTELHETRMSQNLIRGFSLKEVLWSNNFAYYVPSWRFKMNINMLKFLRSPVV